MLETILTVCATFLITAFVSLLVLWRKFKVLKRKHEADRRTTEALTEVLVEYAEFRGSPDAGHAKNVRLYTQLLLEELSEQKTAPEVLTQHFCRAVVRASPLHDIGKLFLPSEIFLKNGPLTVEERQLMQTHCVQGEAFLRSAEDRLPFSSFLGIARNMVISHHECWNGTGYPFQISGDEIPWEGRVMALVDVYDALRRPKVYRPAVSHNECVHAILALSGIQFDPQVVDAFLARQEDFRRLSGT